MVCDTLDINITVELSESASKREWEEYGLTFNDTSLYFTQYLRSKYSGVKWYNWSIDYKRLILYFESEEHKTWFLLNYEW